METAAEEQGHLVPNFEVGHRDAVIDINRDDEFDFEIGGDENLPLVEEANDAYETLADQADGVEAHGTDAHVNDSYTYQPQEQVLQASAVDPHDQESHEQSHEELDLETSAFDNIDDTADLTDAAQGDGQGASEYHNQEEKEENEGSEGNEEHEEHLGDVSHEEIDYEETAGEFDGFSNVAQPEIGEDHELMNAATSVEYILEEDDHQKRVDEADADQHDVQVDTNILPEGEYTENNTEDNDVTGEDEKEEVDAQDASVAAEAYNGSTGNNSADASLAQNASSAEVIDGSLDQPNWNAEDQEHQTLTARPNVTISYRGQEYFLFAENSDEDPDTYFLDEVDSIYQPLSQFLGDVREVISSEVETGHGIFMKIDGLGLEFGESTAKDFLDQTTFAQIIDVNNKLVQQDGGSKSPELYIYLSVRSNPLHRFTELANGADEGQGLSNFEKYYEETSTGVSVTNEEGQDDFTQDILSEDLSFDGAHGKTDEVTGGTGSSYNAEQYHNPFRVGDDQQEPLVDANISDVAETEAAEPDALTLNEKEDGVFDENRNVDAEFAGGEENNSLGLDATDAEKISFDDALGDGISVSGQVEEDVAESCVDSHDAASQDVGDAGKLDEQTEVQIDFSKETHERTDGENSFSLPRSDCVGPGPCLCDNCYDLAPLGFEGGCKEFLNTAQASTSTGSTGYVPISEEEWDLMTDSNMDNTIADKNTQGSAFIAANDEDYLDLGDDGDQGETAYHADEANDDAAGHLNTFRPGSHSSSASATLDGEDSGHGDDAAVNQSPADPSQAPNSTEVDTSQPEVDEIDWNHDEDEEIGVAAQNPTGLSPSSPSAKRSRQEDEGASGLGDESGTCWVYIIPQTSANMSPAVKRRRT